MRRTKAKIKEQITARLEQTIYLRLTEFAEGQERSVNFMVEKALVEFLEKYSTPEGMKQYVEKYSMASQGRLI